LGKEAGQKAEMFFSSLLYKAGLDYTFEDVWYDYKVEGQKVELKSCQMTIKHSYSKKCKRKKDHSSYRIGRFVFSSQENREKALKENIWIALLVRHGNQFIIYGFLRAKDVENNRYLTLHKARELKPLRWKEWLKQLGFTQKKRDCPYCGREIEQSED